VSTNPTGSGEGYSGPGAASSRPAGSSGADVGATSVGGGGLSSPASESHPNDDRSLGDIVGDIVKDLGALIRQELDLAKTEAKADVAKAGKGAGMLGGAGVAALLTLIFVSLALSYLLDNVMPDEVAALIVGVLWAIVAGVLAMSGKKQLQNVNPALETTQQTLKEDAQWAKAQKSS